MKKGTTGRASAHIEAPPADVYAAVSDIRRMGEWSPECRRCQWVGGATGPAVGARFKGSNQKGVFRWSTTPRVVAADPGREFSFVIDSRGRDLTRWTYRFEPEGAGTRVTESFEMLHDEPLLYDLAQRHLMRIKDRRADLERGMAATLERIRATVEAARPVSTD